MSELKIKCYNCGSILEFQNSVSRNSECENCLSDVKCCRNCCFYDKFSNHQCKEPNVEFVREKDRSNFCDLFAPLDLNQNKKNIESSREKLIEKAESLFKK